MTPSFVSFMASCSGNEPLDRVSSRMVSEQANGAAYSFPGGHYAAYSKLSSQTPRGDDTHDNQLEPTLSSSPTLWPRWF